MKYKNTPVGAVPENWEVLLFSEVIEKVIDYRGKTPEKSQAGVLLLTAKNVKKGYIQSEPREYIKNEDYSEWMIRGLPEINDVLLTTEAPMGNVALLKVERVALAQRLLTLRGKKDTLFNPYLMYFLLSEVGQAELSKRTGGSTVEGIKSSELKKIFVVCPPYNEQKKIAEILTSVDRVIELTSMEIDKLKDLKKGMMQELLTRGIGHTKFKDSPVGKIPESWEIAKITDVSKLVTKGTTPTTMGFEYLDNGVNFIKVESILENGVIESRYFSHISEEAHNSLKRSQLEEDDIVITIAGATVGKLAIIKRHYLPANTNQALAIIRLNKNKILPKYLFYFLQSGYITDEIAKIATVGAQPNLSLAQIGNFKVALPNLEEQHKILNIIISIDAKIESLRSKDKSLKGLRKGLMNDLLTGKVRGTA